MQFFSIFDMIAKKAKDKNMTMEDVCSYFRSHKVSKSKLFSLRETSFFPEDPLIRSSITSFLEMSELEIALSMGRIPAEYRESFFDSIPKIAAFLQESPVSANTDIITPCFETDLGRLYNGDCIKIMRSLPDNCVDLIFADPPFNLGKTYDPGIDDNMSMSSYINWTYEWLDECIRILKPGGRIFVYNIPKWSTYIAAHLEERLTFWDWIAIDMKFSLPIQNRLYPAHYALVSFIKGVQAQTYHNQRIPLQTCRHCGGEIKDYGGYKGKMNPLGVNVSDVWTDIFPVRHRSTKTRKYNELSVKLLNRIISMATNEGDTVFDPFGGSGTTFAVAQMLNRRWVGCELGDCEIIASRLQNPARDREQLNKIQEESNCLFTPRIEQLRKNNGFWICPRCAAYLGRNPDQIDKAQLSFYPDSGSNKDSK